jgi:outer membrane protein TolC
MMPTLFVLLLALLAVGCNRSNDSALAQARAESEAAKADLAKERARAETAEAELAKFRALVPPQLKLEFSRLGVSITPSLGESDDCVSEWLDRQWLAAA